MPCALRLQSAAGLREHLVAAGRARRPCRRSGGTPRPARACAPAGRCVVDRRRLHGMSRPRHAVAGAGSSTWRRAEVERDAAEVERHRRRLGRARDAAPRRGRRRSRQLEACVDARPRRRRRQDARRVERRRRRRRAERRVVEVEVEVQVDGCRASRPSRRVDGLEAATAPAADRLRQRARAERLDDRGAGCGSIAARRAARLVQRVVRVDLRPSSCALAHSSPSPRVSANSCVASSSKPLVSRRLA